VLAAPGRYVQYQVTDAAIDRLLTVAAGVRQRSDRSWFEGGFDGTVLFKEANAIYLVTQMGIPELRNSTG